MPGQDYNWGNDFISAYMGGVQQRLAREKQQADQRRIMEMMPYEKARLQAETDHLEQAAEAEKAGVGYQHEMLKHQLIGEYASGLRTAQPALQNAVMPGAQNVQPNIGDGLNNNPNVDPRLLAILQQHGAIPGQPQSPEQQVPEALQPNSQQNDPANWQQQLQNLIQNRGQQVQPGQVQQQQPQITREPQYQGISQPSSDQFPEVDKRIDPAGYMHLQDVTTPDQADTRTMKQKMIDATLKTQQVINEKTAEAPITMAIDKAKAGAVGEETRKTEAVKSADALKLRQQQDIASMQRTQATVAGHVLAANIMAAARIAAAKFSSSTKQLDPGEVADAQHSVLVGDTPMPGLGTPVGRAVNSANVAIGAKPLDPKVVTQINALHDSDELIAFMQDTVKNAPDGILGSWRQAALAKIHGTDASNVYGQALGRGGMIAHVYGGMVGRVSDKEVQRVMNIINDGTIPKDQAIARIGMIRQEKSGKLRQFLAGEPPAQMITNMERNGFDPGNDGGFTRVGNQQIPNFVKDGDSWRVYDPKKGGYSLVKPLGD